MNFLNSSGNLLGRKIFFNFAFKKKSISIHVIK